MKKTIRIMAVAAGLGLAASTQAATFVGSSGSLAAQVDFSVSGTSLTVVLANTSLTPSTVPADMLTAVFFNFAGAGTLTPVSAVLSPGSTVFHGTSDPGGVVGGEWGVASSLSGAPGGASYGISSTGIGLFGNANFPGSNLSGPGNGALDGPQFGIASAGSTAADGNPEVQNNPFIHNSVTFTLTVPSGLSDSAISGIVFQYGTSLTEPSFPGFPPEGGPVPDGGSTIALLGFALVGADILRRKVVKA